MTASKSITPRTTGKNLKCVRTVSHVAVVAVGVAFLLAGLLKLSDAEPLVRGLMMAGVAKRLAIQIGWFLPPIEILLGLSLLLQPQFKGGVLFSIILLGGFIIYLGRLAVLDVHSSCGCFGRIGERLFGASLEAAITRNILMMAALGVWLVLAWRLPDKAFTKTGAGSLRNVDMP